MPITELLAQNAALYRDEWRLSRLTPRCPRKTGYMEGIFSD